ncbi:Tetraspanin [Caenorhabditis elegans]|uniref:Tetraspanin n=1 Tax=Caenorhabditis elegans TaxID=6239 RepID=Q9U2K6_CAEEL|nr:Tetraspanin [Caenorhabditis elegans]CAB54426.1 Tetraspanin [Caenorhabditis elegans]|eukprot:NP_499724.1 TetraSPanin family [Caenorhabditis elegans]
MSFCTFLARIFLFFLNLAQTLVGFTVIALTLWIRFDKGFESEIRTNILRDNDPEPLAGVKSDIRTGIIVSFWIIIGFAIANVIIGFVGVIGAVIRSKYLLAPYFLFMVILFLLEIAIGITVLVKRRSVRRTVKEYVFDSFNMNAQADISAFNFRYNCCGAENLPNLNCFAGQPTCSSAVWDRLDFTMMIFGICMLIIVVLQMFTAFLTVPIIIERKRETSYQQ